jgi:tetratricopeptide (TPR) repeat protein
MVRLFRFIWRLMLPLLVALPAWGAAPTEKGAFDAAVNAFKDGFYQKAEQDLAQFVLQFTNSPRLPEAILVQAQARIQLTNWAGAIELLSTNQSRAGSRADEYLFFLGHALAEKGDRQAACDAFARLAKDFPASSRCLEATIREAGLRSEMREWRQVRDLLRQPEGAFQKAVRGGRADDWVQRGYLLLAEAQITEADYAGAEATLQPLNSLALPAPLEWQRKYLLARAQLATHRTAEALATITNLWALAAQTGRRGVQAESAAFEADILERLGRLDQAIAVYTRNVTNAVPADFTRQALLKIAELSLSLNKVLESAQMMEAFAASLADPAARDLALLTLGELRLRQHVTGLKPAPAQTNAPPIPPVQQALAALTTLLTNSPQSPLIGKAQLNLGWCYWHLDAMPPAQTAFQAAAERLSPSVDQATAYFKLADTQFRQNSFPAALTNYSLVVSRFGGLPEIKTNLWEPALYQIVRAGLAAGDLAATTEAMEKILALFPSGFHADRAVLLAGQEVSRRGNPAVARRVFTDFIQKHPNAPLLPKLKLAIARTYEQENKWEEAVKEYDGWVGSHTRDDALPQAEYLRARANSEAGRYTDALNCFTNFLARYPTNEFAPLAQWWVADYYFRLGGEHLKPAEINYQLLYQNTNWTRTELAYQARMMAGRVAAARFGWQDATNYFLTLYNETNCPADLRAQALFAYGDCLMSRDSPGGKMGDYEEAIRVFSRIQALNPTNRLGVLALGQKAACLLQWAQNDPATNAAGAFQEIINSPYADAAAQAIARVGLGLTLEKQADHAAAPDDKAALLKAALGQYLEVFYKAAQEGDFPQMFWVRKAGLEAARLSESMKQRQQAIHVYERLRLLFPPLGGWLDRKILKAREGLEAPGT